MSVSVGIEAEWPEVGKAGGAQRAIVCGPESV
jgi:hypothetical protein